MGKLGHQRVLLLCCLMAVVISCSKNTLSDRDMRLEQIRSSAEQKRQELSQVMGLYGGLLYLANEQIQNVSLSLEVKDIPYKEEGQVDPIMVPELTGSLRFLFGEEGEESEYINFAIEKAEYDIKKEQLSLVLNNEQYKKLIIDLVHSGDELTGQWTAPNIGTLGAITLNRKGLGASSPADTLQGKYKGMLFRDGNSYYNLSQLSLKTSFQLPEGLKISGTFRIIYGSWESKEYLTYIFSNVKYNPLIGELVFENENNDVMFVGQLSPEGITGKWYSDYTGKMGKMTLKRGTRPPPPISSERLETLKGSYFGALTNTHPQSNLFEIVLVSFVTSQDLSLPAGLRITGKIRFYYDDDLLEWEERDFAQIEYNHYTKQLIAKTGGSEKLTVKLSVGQDKLEGLIEADALGEVATVEVKRQ